MKKYNKIFKEKAGCRLDLGCGENKQLGFIGLDFRKVKGVDVVQDLSVFPWLEIPSECADVVMSSHLLEHINPASSDPRLAGLIDLLLAKRLVSKKDIDINVGEYRFLGGFVRFLDEVWRVLKDDGQLIAVFPYAGSPPYYQDPTHICPISHVTLSYFDPLAKDPDGNLYGLYNVYRPKPWKIVKCFYNPVGMIEVALEKRRIDSSYKVISK